SLMYSADDARFVQQVLGEKLKTSFNRVVQIALIKGREDDTPLPGVAELLPTKANIKAIIDLLSAHQVSTESTRGIPLSLRRQIHPAGPDDSVIIYFSGHGLADLQGSFYLFPYSVRNAGEK